MSEKSMSDIMWEREKRSIPFHKDLPEKYRVHDEIVECPLCKGEMFGRCLCCQVYFCHNCEDGTMMDEEDIIEALQKLSEVGEN